MTPEYCSIIASGQNLEDRDPVMSQGYCHQPVYLGAEVWLAAIGSANGLGQRARPTGSANGLG